MSALPPPRSPTDSDEIDLVEWARMLWSRRFTVGAIGAIGAVLSLLVAFTSPVTFTSSILLVPTETTPQSALGSAASLLGKKDLGQADVDLYQSLLTSRTVLERLLRTPLANRSDSARGRREILSRILKIDTTQPLEWERALGQLPRTIEVKADKNGSSGMVEISIEAATPWLAQEIADELVRAGQEELRRVRAARSDEILARLGSAVESQTKEWERSSQRLCDFRFANRSLGNPVQQLEEDRLSLDLQSMQQSLLLARSEYQQQLLEREKAVAPMVILDPANLPSRKSGPKRLLILMVGTFLFTSGALAFLSGAWLLQTASSNRPSPR